MVVTMSLNKLQKTILERALIKAKIISTDASPKMSTNYTQCILHVIDVYRLTCLASERFYEAPSEYISLEYGVLPDKHIIHFLIDGVRLLMSCDEKSGIWSATRVFIGDFEGFENTVQKHGLQYLFKYPNSDYGNTFLYGIRPTQDVWVYKLDCLKGKELEFEYESY